MEAMSLSVPYVLAAAALAAPERCVPVGEHLMRCDELDAQTSATARNLLREGWRPGDAYPLTDLATAAGLVRTLGALRVGLCLVERGSARPIPADQPPDAAVIMTTIWSETPAAKLEPGSVVSHARLLALAEGDGSQWPQVLEPLRQALVAIMTMNNSWP